MSQSRRFMVGACLAALLSATACAPSSDSNGSGSGGSTQGTGSGGDNGSGSGGNTSTTGTGGSSSGSGGDTGSGSGGNTSTGSGGSSSGSGGNTSTGSGGSSSGSGGNTSTGSGGSSSGSGGNTSTGSGGAPGTGGVRADQGGVPLAKPGDMTSTSRQYLNLGDIRLINNRWGSDELNCGGTQQKVYVNSDSTFGWDFNRPTCGGAKAKPDYPEVEFGVAPFGAGSSLLTTPSFSSTTLLPKQISSLTSASVTVDTLNINLAKPTIWNIDFEVWLSQRNPLTDSNPGVYAEIIAFWGWEDGRWACDKSGNLTSGTHSYHLCHQADDWANGQWRFYNFNVDNGPLRSYNGKVDVKAFIDWVVSKYNLPKDLWLTRIEVGSEIDDNTQGSVKINNLTFEVNGTSKSVELAK